MGYTSETDPLVQRIRERTRRNRFRSESGTPFESGIFADRPTRYGGDASGEVLLGAACVWVIAFVISSIDAVIKEIQRLRPGIAVHIS